MHSFLRKANEVKLSEKNTFVFLCLFFLNTTPKTQDLDKTIYPLCERSERGYFCFLLSCFLGFLFIYSVYIILYTYFHCARASCMYTHVSLYCVKGYLPHWYATNLKHTTVRRARRDEERDRGKDKSVKSFQNTSVKRFCKDFCYLTVCAGVWYD